MSIQQNITSLQNLLEQVNALPEADGVVELPELINEGTAADLLSGKELIDGNGQVITGSFSIDEELTTQDDLIAQIITTVNELPEAGSGEPNLQTKTITPSTNTQTVKPDSGYDGLSQVTVNGDANLVAGNIAEGVSIFGITGTHSGGSSGGGGETCIVTLHGKVPTIGDIEKVFYTNGSSSIQEVVFPTYDKRTSITIIKNSIIFVYGVETDMIGNAIALNNTQGVKAYFISGDTTILS